MSSFLGFPVRSLNLHVKNILFPKTENKSKCIIIFWFVIRFALQGEKKIFSQQWCRRLFLYILYNLMLYSIAHNRDVCGVVVLVTSNYIAWQCAVVVCLYNARKRVDALDLIYIFIN